MLDVASEAFFAHGYWETAVSDLAGAAGLGIGGFYATFAGKEDCFLAVCAREGAAICERAAAALAGDGSEGGGEVAASEESGEVAARSGGERPLALVLQEMAADPRGAHLILAEARAAGPRARDCAEEAEAKLAAMAAQARGAGGPDVVDRALPAALGLLLDDTLSAPRPEAIDLLAGLAVAAANVDGGAGEGRVGAAGRTADDDEVGTDEDDLAGLAKLPPGRHGLPREFVAENQLGRLTVGLIAAVVEHGYEQVTVAAVSEAARLSRRTFYGYFPNKEECFLATYELMADHLGEQARAAVRGERGAQSPAAQGRQVEIAVGAAVDLLAANPRLADFLFVAPWQAERRIRTRCRAAIMRFAEDLAESPVAPGPPETGREQVRAMLFAALIVEGRKLAAGSAFAALAPTLTAVLSAK